MNVILIAIVFILVSLNVYSYFMKKKKLLNNYQPVPKVKGRIPFFGNGIQFIRNGIGFIRNSYKTYGKLFKMNLFGNEFVFICDREMKKIFFKTHESSLSLYSVFESIYVTDALTDSNNDLVRMANMFKSSISLRPEYTQIMNSEARSLIRGLSGKENEPIRLVLFLREYIARTSYRCFVSKDINEEFIIVHYKFAKLVNLSILISYFVPKRILHWFWRPVLRYYRKRMYPLLIDTIEASRKNGYQNEGQLLRKAVDYVDECTGNSLSNDQIADVIIAFMWISTENTVLGLLNAAIDLIVNSKYWTEVKDEIQDYVHNDDFEKIVKNSLLTACIMETARLNTHPISICRVPSTRDLVIGKEKFLIGDANIVTISPPLMQLYECSDNNFKNSSLYNPLRYSENNENYSSKNILTWGAGVHLCPGKEFAITEIKIGLAFLITYLKITHYWGHENVTHFSSSAFVERDIRIKIACDYKP